MADDDAPRWEPYRWADFVKGNEVGIETRFAEGNLAAAKHQAYSPAVYDPLARQIAADLLALAAEEGSASGYLLEPVFASAVLRWATLEARCALIRRWIAARDTPDRPGELDADGEEIGAAKHLLKLEAQAQKAAASLGLDPLSRTRLGRNLASTHASTAQAQAAGAAALAARQAGTTDPTPPPTPDTQEPTNV